MDQRFPIERQVNNGQDSHNSNLESLLVRKYWLESAGELASLQNVMFQKRLAYQSESVVTVMIAGSQTFLFQFIILSEKMLILAKTSLGDVK